MSFDISIINPETGEVRTCDEAHDLRGGNYTVGGTTQAWLNVTYNYSPFYSGLGAKGLEGLDGQTVAEARQRVADTVTFLGINPFSGSYWEATPGNAGAAMHDLLTLMGLCADTDRIEVR